MKNSDQLARDLQDDVERATAAILRSLFGSENRDVAADAKRVGEMVAKELRFLIAEADDEHCEEMCHKYDDRE